MVACNLAGACARLFASSWSVRDILSLQATNGFYVLCESRRADISWACATTRGRPARHTKCRACLFVDFWCPPSKLGLLSFRQLLAQHNAINSFVAAAHFSWQTDVLWKWELKNVTCLFSGGPPCKGETLCVTLAMLAVVL